MTKWIHKRHSCLQAKKRGLGRFQCSNPTSWYHHPCTTRGPLWSRLPGQDETRHRGGSTNILYLSIKPLAIANVFFFPSANFEQNPSASVTGLRLNIIVGLLLEPTLEEFCGGQETGHSKGKTATRLPTKPAGRKQFGGQMENIQAYLDQAYLAQA